jgi:hypothetical protein
MVFEGRCKVKKLMVLGAIVFIILLAVSGCQSSADGTPSSAPSTSSPVPTQTAEAPDDIVYTPGGPAYRANVQQEGVTNPWPPVQTTTVTLNSSANPAQITYRDNIETAGGQTRHNLFYIVLPNVKPDDTSLPALSVTLKAVDLLEGITAVQDDLQWHDGDPARRCATSMTIQIAGDLKPGEYGFKINIMLNVTDYGDIPCTIKVIQNTAALTAIQTGTPAAQSPSATLEETTQPSPTTTQAQLTEQEKQQMWEEKGTYNAETIEEASRIAGFQVASPSYIPEGFARFQNINVTRLGGGLPEGMKPKFSAINVEQMWRWDADRSTTFMLTQSQHKFGIGGDQEQVEIGGLQVTRAVTQTEPPRPNVGYAWEKDGSYFGLFGYLGGPLDEATLEKIVLSVGVPSPASLEDETAIYSAVVRQLAIVDDTFGGNLKPPKLFIIRNTDDKAGNPTGQRSASKTISQTLQDKISETLHGLSSIIIYHLDR